MSDQPEPTHEPSDFSLLSPEQLAALSEELKAVFLALSQGDKEFAARYMNPKDLPVYLSRKAESLRISRQRAEKEASLAERIKTPLAFADNAASPDLKDVGGVLAAGAAAVGIGAVASRMSTDGKARWQGSSPPDLIPSLEDEFEDKPETDLEVKRLSPDHLEATVFLVKPNGGYVPALTVGLVAIDADTVEVQVGDLTSESIQETLKESGRKLLDFVQSGVRLWRRKQRGGIPVGEIMDMADDVFDAHKMVKDLDLKDRAWLAVQKVAGPREEAFLKTKEKARQERFELEAAWDDYYNCPGCSVAYQEGDSECRLCGRARNDPPSRPDPRRK